MWGRSYIIQKHKPPIQNKLICSSPSVGFSSASSLGKMLIRPRSRRGLSCLGFVFCGLLPPSLISPEQVGMCSSALEYDLLFLDLVDQ